jgi:methyl-accepting chemotaxis protein
MSWTVGRKIAVGFTAPVVILIVVGSVAYRSTNRLIDASQQVSHTHEVLTQLERVISTLKDAETGQRGYLLTGAERFLEPYTAAVQSIDLDLKNARKLIVDPSQQRRLDALEPLVTARLESLRATMDLRRQKGLEAAVDLVQTEHGKKIMDDIRRSIDEMESAENELLDQRSRSAQATARNTLATIVLGSLIAFVIVGLVGFFITRSVVTQIRDGINRLVSSATEILAATTQQASGTAEEATAVQETSTTVDELKQTAQLSAQKARAVTEAAQKTAQTSQVGRGAVEESLKGMQEMKARMETIAERILTLSEQGQAIGEVITTVNDLAEQSNLLSVNAAIEAAKAGEAGKGFAVVATEVKALAVQSKQATSQVRGILSEIQRATQAAVMAAEQGVKASEAGLGVVTRAGESIRLLAESLTESAQAAQQIQASAQQQSAGTEQIGLAMQNIQQASTQNMASTRQVERAAQDLNELARRLKALVAGSGNHGKADPGGSLA